ncbi:MAG: ABC transporter ATP-binding protein [Pseudomonadota bacterium]
MAANALDIRDLNLSYRTEQGRVQALRDIELQVRAGQIVGVVGESGSGKSTLVSTIIRLLAPNAQIDSGSVLLAGKNLLDLDASAMRKLRGDEVSMVFQDPMTSLNPVLTIGRQMLEIQYRDASGKANKTRRALDYLERVGLPDPESQLKRYPHQLSGGMRQRVAIAMALMMKPSLLIADEPTTALDATLEVEILARLRTLQQEEGCAILFISHHLGAIAELCESVVVMYGGEIVEQGNTREVFARPQHDYTRMLLASDPAHVDADHGLRGAADHETTGSAALAVQDLCVSYRLPGVRRQSVEVVKGVSFEVNRGETLAVVGESGSGKTSLVKAICGLAPAVSGAVRLNGDTVPRGRGGLLQPDRQRVAMMFQDPVGSLSPRMTVRKLVAEPYVVNREVSGDIDKSALEMLALVGLGAEFADRYPHQLSGGQARRVGLARALAQQPDVLIADEPTAGLDVSIQGEVLNLMSAVQQEFGLAIVIITHNLNIVRHVADRMAIMYQGEFVEQGPADDVCSAPEHPYTKALLAANLTV